MQKVKVSISLSFIGYLLLLILLGRGFFIFTYILVLFVHEYSHATIAYKLGYQLNSIKLAPFGICLNIDNNSIERLDSVKIALAGPIVNFVLAIICMAVWWIAPEIYAYTKDFFEANVITGLFNLLPCYPLDGGRILNELIGGKNKKLFVTINSIFGIMFICLYFIFDKNFSLIIIAAFLICSIFTFSSHQKYDYISYIDKDIKKTIKVVEYAVDCQEKLFRLLTHITPNTYVAFLVFENNKHIATVYENQLKNYLDRFVPTTKLIDVLKK